MKTSNIIIRVSEAFKEKLEELAKANDMSVSEYIRLLVEIEYRKLKDE